MIIHLHPLPPFHPVIITDVLTHYAFCVRNALCAGLISIDNYFAGLRCQQNKKKLGFQSLYTPVIIRLFENLHKHTNTHIDTHNNHTQIHTLSRTDTYTPTKIVQFWNVTELVEVRKIKFNMKEKLSKLLTFLGK